MFCESSSNEPRTSERELHRMSRSLTFAARNPWITLVAAMGTGGKKSHFTQTPRTAEQTVRWLSIEIYKQNLLRNQWLSTAFALMKA